MQNILLMQLNAVPVVNPQVCSKLKDLFLHIDWYT